MNEFNISLDRHIIGDFGDDILVRSETFISSKCNLWSSCGSENRSVDLNRHMLAFNNNNNNSEFI